MDEMISRQAALDALGNIDCSDGVGFSALKYDAINDAVTAIKALPSAQPGWISCSERLPYAEYGESDTVLTTCGYRDVEDTSVRWIRLLYFNGGNWCYPTGETYEAKVYAWMPLPTPWKGEQNERFD